MRHWNRRLSLGLVGSLVLVHGGCRQKGLDANGNARVSEVRAGAPASNIEGEMSADMRAFRDQFIAMKDQNDVDKLLKAATTKLESGEYKDNDIRLVVAQLLPLTSLRGIIWRLTPIVEGRNDTMHSVIVTNLMAIATSSRIFVPQSSQDNEGLYAWKAVNRYLAWPYQGIEPQLKTVAEFQTFLLRALQPRLGKAISLIEAINIPANKPVVWDNMLVFGRGSFGADTDAKDRFATIYEAEKKLVLSGLHSMIHNMLFFYQYNFDAFPEFSKELGKLVGLDGFGPFGVNGMSSIDRAKVLCGSNYPNGGCSGSFAKLFTKREETNVMAEAYEHLREATQLAKTAWDEVKARGGNAPSLPDFQLLDPAKLLPWSRMADNSFNNILAMVEGKPVRSAVTGRVVTANVPAFYRKPPADLKAFMPVAFDPDPRRLSVDGVANVRNYEYGMSTMWNAQAYQPYFPEVATGSEVPRVMRDLAQTWGGWFVNTPFATVSMVF